MPATSGLSDGTSRGHPATCRAAPCTTLGGHWRVPRHLHWSLLVRTRAAGCSMDTARTSAQALTERQLHVCQATCSQAWGTKGQQQGCSSRPKCPQPPVTGGSCCRVMGSHPNRHSTLSQEQEAGKTQKSPVK